MTEQTIPDLNMPDPNEVADTVSKVAEQSQRLVKSFLERRQSRGGDNHPILDPGVVAETFQAVTGKMLSDPGKLVEAQVQFWQDYAELWQSTARRMLAQDAEPVVSPEAGDKRFRDGA